MQGDTIYIVGGGPSLKNFPFEKLGDRETIAVNVSAIDVPNPTYCLTADSSIFRKKQIGKIFKDVDKTTWVLVTNENHVAMKMKDGRFCHVRSKFVYNLFCMDIVIRNAGTDGIGFTFNNFRTGFNSGFCAFQFAVLLRYKKICLLGFDMKKSEKHYHYHNRYHGHQIKEKTFDWYVNNFGVAFREVKKRTGIEVVSMSKDSRLNKFIPYEDFI